MPIFDAFVKGDTFATLSFALCEAEDDDEPAKNPATGKPTSMRRAAARYKKRAETIPKSHADFADLNPFRFFMGRSLLNLAETKLGEPPAFPDVPRTEGVKENIVKPKGQIISPGKKGVKNKNDRSL
jgi:hypothetical protein